MLFRTMLVLGATCALAWAQGVQNQALTGEAVRGAVADKNPFESEADVQQGGGLFQVTCAVCHGARGEGGRGADLTAGIYRNGGSDAELFRSIRSGIPGTEMPASRLSDDEIWKVTGFVKRLGSRGLTEKATGDAAAGKELYVKNGCAGCHRINDQGSDVGPDLTNVGRRRGLAFLEESLVKPDVIVANSYRAVQLVPKSGQMIGGIRLNEDDLSIQIRDMGGNPRSIMKDTLKEVKRDKPSLMPSYERLSKTDLTNLVAYLNSLKGAQ
jgi:putative heme-binding domain-containing protein